MSKVRVGVGDSSLWENRRWLILGVVVFVLLAGVGAFYVLSDDAKPSATKYESKKRPVGESAPLQKVDVQYVQLGDQEITQKVNYMMGTKQYAEAEKLVSMQSDLGTNRAKLNLLLTVQNAQNKKTEAAETTKKIEALGSLGAGDYRRLAEQYRTAGDKARAIDYYNKAIDAYNKAGQNVNTDEIARLKDAIKELQ